ncbi:ABC-2 type transport system ATP-binding protein [Curtobacterium sp. PhB130]|uniref:ABC transporter ATP-binding protein n=1 Tax=unclassified Curtobacterium TaxID=257496 RepID=UPI000F4B909D|nr:MULTISPECIES: ABC transporter ATP-binding protein [unclassified Curtobacterium]ROP60416.1 ABC-2 type transport system ATP-binding protein [Curtobacterium sp. ZW137]ROS76388.1 ABC-2 type transport system ATP-binding protein [Curtobacterium sp. PhB130]TCK59719.1 ABC-2 type transport system ATP-binding protein [Curtobacterium sp. PhB136]
MAISTPVATTTATEPERPEVIVVDHVTKRFTVRKDNTIRERIVTLGRAGRKHRQDFWALDDVSVTIRAGSTVGLIGQNGSGKSTLLKAIGGIIQPTSGTVSRRGRLAALLELGAGFHPDLSGRENVYLNASLLGLSRKQTDERFDDILAFSGIGDFIDTQVKFYSSGMYVRLAFAVAVHTDPDVLLVDEVLAVGDEAFQRKCLDRIRTFQEAGKTIIIVTHSLSQVQEMCDRVVLLNKGKVLHDGDPIGAVSMFRDVLEERRAGELSKDVAVGRGTVLGATVHAEGKGTRDGVYPGDDLVVDMEFEHLDGVTDWEAAVQINNTAGQVVFGTTTGIMGVHLPPLHGRKKLRIRIADTAFGTGKYFINVSMMDSAGRHLHDLPECDSFEVPAFGNAVGTVYAEPSLEDVD